MSPAPTLPPDVLQHRLQTHWRQAWRDLQLPTPDALFVALMAAWSQPWRHYHAPQHLGECLDALARERAHAHRPGEIALALFFHDAVYDLQASDNEARSADWADRALTEAHLPPAAVARVHALVMATCHGGAPGASSTHDAAIAPDAARAAPTTDAVSEPDEHLLVDIDLAILGAPPARFAEYEAQIRREYAHVSPDIFEPRRRRILGGFLAREPIYRTPGMRARCEAQARVNLAQAVAAP